MTYDETHNHVMSRPLQRRTNGVEGVSDARIVHIIDDDILVRHLIEGLLEDTGFQTQCHRSASIFLRSYDDTSAGCVIADVRMPEMSGIDLLEELQRSNNRLPLIVISGEADVALAVDAMKKGASDFLEKPFPPDSLVAAVRDAMAPNGGQRSGLNPGKLAMLSARERQILKKLVEGKSSKIIAYELGISMRTVESHRAKIKTKTGCRSITELVLMEIASE